jgi:hypothetical protein
MYDKFPESSTIVIVPGVEPVHPVVEPLVVPAATVIVDATFTGLSESFDQSNWHGLSM